MPLAEDMKNIVENILSSYEARIQSIGSIFDTTHLILGDFQQSFFDTKQEREKINTQLRDTLAKNEHLRRKDFDNMMQGILATQDEREKEVGNLLKEYFNDQKTMAQALRENLEKFRGSLSKGEAGRVKEFQEMVKEILAKQDERKDEVTSKLKEFQKEQRDLAIRLKKLLVKGKELRIKDLKSMLKEFRAQREKRLALQNKRREEVVKMLNSFKKKRQKVKEFPRTLKNVGFNIDGQNNQQKNKL